MLNWRYLGHPSGGGAEVLSHEVLKRMVAAGHEVTCFSGDFPGATPEGELDGVKLVRKGRQWTVHFHAWRWLRTRLDDFDVVIDQINTIPFLTPWYVPAAKRWFWINQLAREFWWRETRGVFRLISPLGYLSEPLYLRLYRRTRGITISRSSLEDMLALGVPERLMTVIPMASDVEALEALPPKAGPPTVLIIGRLTQAKFVEEAIDAFAVMAAARPDVTLRIAGDGDPAYRTALEAQVLALGLEERVTFLGRVSHERKRELQRDSHLHVFASHREGWGLTVTEAGALGTPSVGYDVPGVRDSVAVPEQLAPARDAQALGRAGLALLQDADRYERARRTAWENARALSYDRTAEVFRAAVIGDEPR